MLSRDEFVERHRHVFGGLVSDAATRDCKGADLSIRLRNDFRKIDAELSKIYEELTAKPATVNGQAQPKKEPAK